MKEGKGKQPIQPDKEEREVVYSQIAQNMEKMRKVVRSSISRNLLFQLKSNRWL